MRRVIAAIGVLVVLATLCIMWRVGRERLNRRLFEAVERNDLEAVRQALDDGADPNYMPCPHCPCQTTLLAYALRPEQIDVARLLIARGADVTGPSSKGKTVLHEAVLAGNNEIVPDLLRAGADINAKADGAMSPLENAAGRGRKEVGQVLVAHGAEITLHSAAAFGTKETLQKFLADGGSVHAKGWGDMTPLHMAAANGHTETAEMLLTEGADINAATEDGRTPLWHAVEHGRRECVELLVARGADLGVTVFGDALLHTAAEEGHKEIVKILLDKGQDPNLRDCRGRTPFSIASARKHRHVADLLNRYGGVPAVFAVPALFELQCALRAAEGAGDKAGTRRLVDSHVHRNGPAHEHAKLLLHWAIYEGHLEAVKALTPTGGDVNAPTQFGDRPLNAAARGGYAEIVEFLIANGASPHSAGVGGNTPLHDAVAGGHPDVAELLISKDGSVNARNDLGRTPLHSVFHFAAPPRYMEQIAGILLRNGADVNAVDLYGNTPLDIAHWRQQDDTTALLVQHGAKTGKELKQEAAK